MMTLLWVFNVFVCWMMVFCPLNVDVQLCKEESLKMINQLCVLNNFEAFYSFDVDF
jgi:hypothetical protein